MAKTAIWPSRLISLEDLPRELEAHQGELRLAMPCAWRRPRESTASHTFRMHAPHTHPPREWREFLGASRGRTSSSRWRSRFTIRLNRDGIGSLGSNKDGLARTQLGRAETAGPDSRGSPLTRRHHKVNASSPTATARHRVDRGSPLVIRAVIGADGKACWCGARESGTDCNTFFAYRVLYRPPS